MVVESRGQGLEVYLAAVAKWYACHWSWAGMRVDRGSKGWLVGCYKSGFRADYVTHPLEYPVPFCRYRSRHPYHLARWQRIKLTSTTQTPRNPFWPTSYCGSRVPDPKVSERQRKQSHGIINAFTTASPTGGYRFSDFLILRRGVEQEEETERGKA